MATHRECNGLTNPKKLLNNVETRFEIRQYT